MLFCHAQFPDTFPTLQSLLLVDIITGTEPTKLIFALYNALHTPTATCIAYGVKSQWEPDVEILDDGERGDELLEGPKFLSPKLSDRLTQTIYYT